MKRRGILVIAILVLIVLILVINLNKISDILLPESGQTDFLPAQEDASVSVTNDAEKTVAIDTKNDVEVLPTIKSSELPNALDDSYDWEQYRFLHGGNVGEDGKYTRVLVDGEAVEESISIVFSEVVSDIQPKPVKETSNQYYPSIIESQLKEYGELAQCYLPEETINNYYQADVDSDGEKEELLTLCSLGANHCSSRSEIIKDGKVIFSTDLGANGIGITPAIDGFYVEWTADDSYIDENGDIVGLCCLVNHHKTLFQFQDGKFKPVKQWKIDHIWKQVIGG